MRQSDLARAVGVSKDEMWNIEHGRTDPPASLVAKIAKALGATVKELAAIEVRDGAGNGEVVVIVSRWNEFVTRELRLGAEDELRRAGIEGEFLEVPGAWEMPLAVRAVLERANPPSAVVALGCILQGETPHAKLLAADAASALMGLQLEYGVPVAWGILTPDTAEQAIDRAGMKLGNKGREATQAALEMMRVLEQIGE